MASPADLTYGPGESPLGENPTFNPAIPVPEIVILPDDKPMPSYVPKVEETATETPKLPKPNTPPKTFQLPDGEHPAEDADKQDFVLKVAQRLNQLPVVQCASGVYRAAKVNSIAGKFIYPLELISIPAINLVHFMGESLMYRCEYPVRAMDWLLCKGLDVTEKVIPCLAVPPSEMCGATASCLTGCVCCLPRSACNIASTVCPVSEKDPLQKKSL